MRIICSVGDEDEVQIVQTGGGYMLRFRDGDGEWAGHLLNTEDFVSLQRGTMTVLREIRTGHIEGVLQKRKGDEERAMARDSRPRGRRSR